MGVVNRVMKPDGQLHRNWLMGYVFHGIELGKAIGNVAKVVVMPMWLGVQGNQFLISGKRIAGGGHPLPESNPAF